MRYLLLLTFLSILLTQAQAQSTTLTPGTVLPSMTTAQRIALASPTNGMLIFDTNTQSYWYRQTGGWIEVHKGGSTSNYWQVAGLGGNEITNTNSGGFWSANPTGVFAEADNTTNPPTVPVIGTGTRLMWIPSRSAFRVGTVNIADRWSAANIGLFSLATGFNSQASGKHSMAMGFYSQAVGEYTTAIGDYTTATGEHSTAIGSSAIASGYAAISLGASTEASGVVATAMGFDTRAPGNYATAMGFNTNASGFTSTALGNNNAASGRNSTATGYSNKASGDYSTTMGTRMNANNLEGTFMIGDSDPTNEGETVVGFTDQFVGRFYNGYYLMTSGDNTRTGAYMGRGESAWNTVSDSTRKEKIVLADGESFLLKLRNLRLGSWNYKNQGAKPGRFYGPMAQEIFAAFGKDKYGTIGNDTTVSTMNMDGLLFIFSQALEKRTQDLRGYTASLEKRTVLLEAENRQLKAMMQKMEARLENLESVSEDKSKNKQATDK